VVVRVVVATGAGSQYVVALEASRVAPSGASSGGIATYGAAANGWHQAVAHASGLVGIELLLSVLMLQLLVVLCWHYCSLCRGWLAAGCWSP
jgi:hypothetical protein